MIIESTTYLGSVDDLVGEALRDGLKASEGGLAGALADQVDSLVDSAEGRHVDGLSADDTTRSDTGGVLASARLGNGVDTDLNGVLAGEKMNQFHGLLDNFDSLLLFTVVSVARGHQHAGDSLDNGALGLLESTLLVATGGVWHEHLLASGLDSQVVGERGIGARDTLVGPPSEKFGFNSELRPVIFLKANLVLVVCTKKENRRVSTPRARSVTTLTFRFCFSHLFKGCNVPILNNKQRLQTALNLRYLPFARSLRAQLFCMPWQTNQSPEHRQTDRP